MSTAHPFPRDTRERFATVASGQTEFGPFDFKIFSADDVEVHQRAGASDRWLPVSSFSATLSGVAPAYFSVVVPGAVAGFHLRIRGARTHERITDVVRSGVVNSKATEEQFDMITVILQEMRRDVSSASDAADLIEQVVSDGPVQAVNGKSGDVTLTGTDLDVDPGVSVSAAIKARVPALASLVALLAFTPQSGAAVAVLGYFAGTDVGGGLFWWDASRAKSQHNGGTIISPTVPWDGTQGALAAFLAGTGETTPAGNGCWVREAKGRELRPEWFGARGDGVTNDVAAFTKMASLSPKRFRLDAATYLLSTELVLSGRVELIGVEGHSVLKGPVRYGETAFPTAADTLTPLTTAAPHFFCEGVSFDNPDAAGYSLRIEADFSTVFEDTFTLRNCGFYGINGLRVRHGYNSSIVGCAFNSRDIGAWMEGCTNITYDGCRWNNHRNIGLNITLAPDVATRLGGELHKVVNCQFAVCTTGIKALLSRWLTLDNVLIDYCAAPVVAYGCLDHLVTNCYFGASNVPVSRFAGQPGYVAPDVQDIAFYGAAYTYSSTVYAIGGTHHANWYVNYRGASNPLFWFASGGASATYTTNMLRMGGCSFLVDASQAHTMNYYLVADKATNVSVVGNYFEAPTNPSGSMVDLYSWPSGDGPNIYCAGNKTRNADDGGTALPPSDFEQPDFVGHGVKTGQPLKFRRSNGAVVPIMQVTAGDITQLMLPVNNTGKFQIVDQSGTVLFEVGQTATKLLCAGTLRTIGNGNTDTAGAGYRTAIFPNNG